MKTKKQIIGYRVQMSVEHDEWYVQFKDGVPLSLSTDKPDVVSRPIAVALLKKCRGMDWAEGLRLVRVVRKVGK